MTNRFKYASFLHLFTWPEFNQIFLDYVIRFPFRKQKLHHWKLWNMIVQIPFTRLDFVINHLSAHLLIKTPKLQKVYILNSMLTHFNSTCWNTLYKMYLYITEFVVNLIMNINQNSVHWLLKYVQLMYKNSRGFRSICLIMHLRQGLINRHGWIINLRTYSSGIIPLNAIINKCIQ